METSTIIAIVVAVAIALLVVGIAVVMLRRRQGSDLESRYGTEYRREVKMRGRRKAEAELTQREARVSAYRLRTLEPEERTLFSERWTGVQAEFVDDPRTALQHADVLLQDVMTARGYPVADFDQRAADLSVEYGDMVRNYRSAQSISQQASGSTTSTEDLRRGLLLYRTMFEKLLATGDDAIEEAESVEEPVTARAIV
jgi:hypothetical protein